MTTRIDVDDTVLKLAITRKIVVNVFSALESRGYSTHSFSFLLFFFFFKPLTYAPLRNFLFYAPLWHSHVAEYYASTLNSWSHRWRVEWRFSRITSNQNPSPFNPQLQFHSHNRERDPQKRVSRVKGNDCEKYRAFSRNRVISVLMNFFVPSRMYEWPHLNAPPFGTPFAHKYLLTPPFHWRFAVINISCNDFCTPYLTSRSKALLVIELKLPSAPQYHHLFPFHLPNERILSAGIISWLKFSNKENRIYFDSRLECRELACLLM